MIHLSLYGYQGIILTVSTGQAVTLVTQLVLMLARYVARCGFRAQAGVQQAPPRVLECLNKLGGWLGHAGTVFRPP